MTTTPQPDTYRIPGQLEEEFGADKTVQEVPRQGIVFPMSELDRLTQIATEAAAPRHSVLDFGEPVDERREEYQNVGGGAVSAFELTTTTTNEEVLTSPAVLVDFGSALMAFRQGR